MEPPSDARSTRRGVCLLALTLPIAGCVSDPGADCRGATVRLSLRSVDSVETPLVFDTERLSAEAVAVIETAIGSEHVEHCVSWDPDPDETGPSPGLAEVGESIEAHTGSDLPSDVEADVRFRGEPYRLSLITDHEG
ncbi:hypothetical protein [Natronomonas sp. LN261]|jgi:hypothetical protein|uniref:hypothetical protein n=1 Tax=Natronomonas sp. LN261 TaxID=2750669 RepID=UPI0015EFDB1A|nr:hypothetical protein [Natronomonas sp. LN261]